MMKKYFISLLSTGFLISCGWDYSKKPTEEHFVDRVAIQMSKDLGCDSASSSKITSIITTAPYKLVTVKLQLFISTESCIKILSQDLLSAVAAGYCCLYQKIQPTEIQLLEVELWCSGAHINRTFGTLDFSRNQKAFEKMMEIYGLASRRHFDSLPMFFEERYLPSDDVLKIFKSVDSTYGPIQGADLTAVDFSQGIQKDSSVRLTYKVMYPNNLKGKQIFIFDTYTQKFQTINIKKAIPADQY